MARAYFIFLRHLGNVVAGLVSPLSAPGGTWAVPRSGGENIIFLDLQEHPVATVAVAIISISSVLVRTRTGLNTFETRRPSDWIDGRPLEPRIERKHALRLLLTVYTITTTAPSFS